MQYLNIFLSLLNKTQSRDKVLRIVQYATLHSEEHLIKGNTYAVYTQVRRTRKWLRFLAWIQMLVKLKNVKKQFLRSKDCQVKLAKAMEILQGICKVLFYLTDHLVVLGQLEIAPKGLAAKYEPKSMLMYLLQNLFGAAKNLVELMAILQKGPQHNEGFHSLSKEEDKAQGEKEVRNKSIELLRCILDIMVACYYLRRPADSAHRVGIIGVVTTFIVLGQHLGYI